MRRRKHAPKPKRRPRPFYDEGTTTETSMVGSDGTFPVYDVVLRHEVTHEVILGQRRVRMLEALLQGEALVRHEAGVLDELGTWTPVTREQVRWTGYWPVRPCGDCAGYPGHFTDCAIHGEGRRDLD